MGNRLAMLFGLGVILIFSYSSLYAFREDMKIATLGMKRGFFMLSALSIILIVLMVMSLLGY